MSPIAAAAARRTLPEGLREDFPVLARKTRGGRRLVYLDSAATSQKPAAVIETLSRFYRHSNANIHRGLHELSEEATGLYDAARARVAAFLRAPDPACVIFTRNATESINLVAHGWGRKFLAAGDEVLLSEMEHHSNLVPWHILSKERGVVLRHIPVGGDGRLDLTAVPRLLSSRTRLVSITGMSNVLGTVNPVSEIAQAAHAAGALLLVDGAQSVPHRGADVAADGFDFLAFSAHKMLGPTGVGVLWGRRELLDAMDPFLGGGDMIRQVFLDRYVPDEVPRKFEAGTPAIADVVAFGAAVDYLSRLGMAAVAAHERELVAYCLERLSAVPGVQLFGPRETRDRGGVVSFNVDGVHPHDVGQILDSEGIAIRAGHHCCQPLMRRLDVAATARASFYVYNTREDVDALASALDKVKRTFRVA